MWSELLENSQVYSNMSCLVCWCCVARPVGAMNIVHRPQATCFALRFELTHPHVIHDFNMIWNMYETRSFIMIIQYVFFFWGGDVSIHQIFITIIILITYMKFLIYLYICTYIYMIYIYICDMYIHPLFSCITWEIMSQPWLRRKPGRPPATSLRPFLPQLVAAAQHRMVAAMLRRRAGKRLATHQCHGWNTKRTVSYW